MRRLSVLCIILLLGGAVAWAQTRTVTQTVFDADGRPAANAALFASYAVGEQGMIAQAMADNQGRVTWTNLPAARVIVWGAKVPACVMPANATDITTPLPAPAPEGREFCIGFELPAVADKPGNVLWMVDPPGNSGMLVTQYPYFANQAIRSNYNQYHVVAGTRYTMAAVALTDPPSVAMLRDVYAPYTNAVILRVPATWQPGISIHGRCVTKDGTPVIGVSHLQIEPVALPGLPSALVNEMLASPYLSTQFFADQGKGMFTLLSPVPGSYRAYIDLFDKTAPTPPELQFEVKADTKEITLTLPEPLLTVPAGATINWLTMTAPLSRHRLTSTAYTQQMPVYGPKDGLLALWYNPAPNKLTLYTPGAGGETPRTLSLRTVYLNLHTADGKAADMLQRDGIMLLPLLPEGLTGMMRYISVNPEDAETASMPCYLLKSSGTKLNAWPGQYLVFSRTAALTPLEIPAEGKAEISVQLSDTTLSQTPATRRTILVKLPDGVAPTLAQQTAVILFDTASDQLLMNLRWAERPLSCSAPGTASKMTILVPGAGIARDIPIPAGDAPTIMVPTLEPGVTVSGTVLDAQGHPRAKSQLVAGVVGAAGQVGLFTTDAEGKFSICGLLPGMRLTLTLFENQAGWTLAVPAEGLTGVTLRQAENPLRLKDVIHARSGKQQTWWVADHGPAVMFINSYDSVSTNELITYPGHVWAIDGESGNGKFVPYSPSQSASGLHGLTGGPGLGLYFPLDAAAGLPGMVTLRGQGDRSWVDLSFPTIRWQPSTALGLVMAQIDAVPPGTYTVMAETLRGPAQTTVTVTENGGVARFAYPALVGKP